MKIVCNCRAFRLELTANRLRLSGSGTHFTAKPWQVQAPNPLPKCALLFPASGIEDAVIVVAIVIVAVAVVVFVAS